MEYFPIRTLGRAKVAVGGSVVRELTEEDLPALAVEKGSKASPIKRLSQRHHNLARAIASGCSKTEAALRCNYELSRVSILCADPSFKELVAFYTANLDAVFLSQHEQLANVSRLALAEIEERLEETADKVPLGHLMEIAKLGADRTGYGPQTSSMNVNVHVGLADRLKQARERVDQRRLANGN